MRRTIRKWFWAWDFEKEEKWLNEMSAIGLNLIAVSKFSYIFDEGISGEYAVRLELLKNHPNHPESIQYIKFIEDTGAEYIGSHLRWVYFRKKTIDGSFDLFSNIESKIGHLNRILFLFGVFFIINIIQLLNNLTQYFYGSGLSASFIAGILNGIVALLFLNGFIRIYKKKRNLKKDMVLYE